MSKAEDGPRDETGSHRAWLLGAYCRACARITDMVPPIPKLVVNNRVGLRIGRCAECGGETFRVSGARGADAETRAEASEP